MPYWLLIAQQLLSLMHCGSVVDEQAQPVSGAIVRYQASAQHTYTDSDGAFCLPPNEQAAAAVTAWADGFYITGLALSDSPENDSAVNDSPVNDPTFNAPTFKDFPNADLPADGNTPVNGLQLVLRRLPESAEGYRWLHATLAQDDSDPELEPCSACHSRITSEWQQSPHGRSHDNALFTAVLAQAGEDFGSAPQQCRLCHQPQQAEEPIGCDFCHKIAAVNDGPSQRLGLQRITLRTPADEALFFGSLDDVYARADTYHPLYRSSSYCASCHSGRFWSNDIYSEFSEWQATDYAARGVQCQDCHMRTAASYAADGAAGGIERSSDSLSSHRFSLRDKTDLLPDAASLEVEPQLHGERLEVAVTLSNTGAGHHLPTGSPLRHLLLLVEAKGQSGLLRQLEGERIPSWAGTRWRGTAGKGYARILAEIPNYRGLRETHFKPVYPAPFWRPTLVESDSRLPAGASDRIEFAFAAPETEQQLELEVRVLFLPYFSDWLNLPAPQPVTLLSHTSVVLRQDED